MSVYEHADLAWRRTQELRVAAGAIEVALRENRLVDAAFLTAKLQQHAETVDALIYGIREQAQAEKKGVGVAEVTGFVTGARAREQEPF